ncbi:MAG TPA: hypothetical protein PKH43_10940 [Saprospiraceae bacterium]|nr:hypothetical protein [Saprospiraceae bacterium]
MLKHLLFLLLFALCGTGLGAQSFQNGPVLDLNLGLGFPTGEYSESTNDVGFGLNLGLFFPVSRRVPALKVGPDFSFLWTAWDTERINERIEVSLNGQVIDVIDLPLRIETTNTIIGGNAVFRANAPISPYVEPYVQGLIGFRRFATTVRIYDWIRANFG